MEKHKINIFRKLLIVVLSVATFVSAGFVVLNSNGVYAQSLTQPNTQLFLPNTELEYTELVSPIDAYSSDNVTAIIQSSHTAQSVLLYTDGNYTSLDGTYNTSNNFNPFTALNQIKKLNDDTLLITNQALISAISINGEIRAEELEDNNSNSIRGNYFDVNGNHLVIAYGTQAFVYSYSSDIFTMESELTIANVKGNAPIALNANGDIIYVSAQDELFKTSVNGINKREMLYKISPDSMVVNDAYLFYIFNDEIFKLAITEDSPSPVKLNVIGNEKYDLGRLKNPMSLSFKGDNLLITDNDLHAVQEFAIDGDKLIFTGYAIGKNLTAYNRIGVKVTEEYKGAIDVEKYGDHLAVLDHSKLSIIDTSNNFSAYDKNRFTDYFPEDLNGTLPNAFALGNGTVLLSFIHGGTTGYLQLLDLKTKNISQNISGFENVIIKDVCYQSGKYYTLVSNGITTSVLTAVEKTDGLQFSETGITVNYNAILLAVDVFENIYVVKDVTFDINAYNKADNYTSPAQLTSVQKTIKKLTTDLDGGVFALTNDSVCYLIDNRWENIELSMPNTISQPTIKSFALNFDKKEVFIIYENEELIYKTTALPNFALSTLPVPTEYVTTAVNADINQFKAYKSTIDANVYNITKTDGQFIFNHLIESRDEYALICSVTETNAYGKQIVMYALAGLTDTV